MHNIRSGYTIHLFYCNTAVVCRTNIIKLLMYSRFCIIKNKNLLTIELKLWRQFLKQGIKKTVIPVLLLESKWIESWKNSQKYFNVYLHDKSKSNINSIQDGVYTTFKVLFLKLLWFAPKGFESLVVHWWPIRCTWQVVQF